MDRWEKKGERVGTKNFGERQGMRENTILTSGACFPCTASAFTLSINSHHGGTWDSPVGKPRGKATDPLIHAKGSVTLLLQLGRKAHVYAPIQDED